jgi:transposase
MTHPPAAAIDRSAAKATVRRRVRSSRDGWGSERHQLPLANETRALLPRPAARRLKGRPAGHGGTLPVAHLDPAAREIRLSVDHREDLVRERTAQIQRLRWHLYDVDSGLEPRLRGLRAQRTRRSLAHRLARRPQTVQVAICRELLGRISELTRRERELRGQISDLVRTYCPRLLELPGCGELTAARLVAEIAGAERFSSDAQLARHCGCAPLPASSGSSRRHRLSRRGNRKLNCAFHRIAVTQARINPETRAYLDRKRAQGHSTREALRCLKRHLVRRAWQLLRARPERIDSPSQMTNSPKSWLAPVPGLT